MPDASSLSDCAFDVDVLFEERRSTNECIGLLHMYCLAAVSLPLSLVPLLKVRRFPDAAAPLNDVQQQLDKVVGPES